MSARKGPVVRLDHERFSVDFTFRDRRVRGIITAEALAALVRGEVDRESNLPLGKAPISFADYVKQSYIPFSVVPRFPTNRKSYDSEINLVDALTVSLGKKYLHEIGPQEAKQCRNDWLKQGRVNSVVKKRLHCLGRVMDHAVEDGALKQNRLTPVKGLPSTNRSDMWFDLPKYDLLIPACPLQIRGLTEWCTLTGARGGEGRDARVGDIDLVAGKVRLPTEKHGVPQRQNMRELDIASLGPRFARLVQQLRPHPKTGFYFTVGQDGRPISEAWMEKLFKQTIDKLGPEFEGHIFHDTRRTFLNHRVPFVKFYRAMYEMGHDDPSSVRAYFDRPKLFNPRDSLFYGATFETTLMPTPAPTFSAADADALIPRPPTLH